MATKSSHAQAAQVAKINRSIVLALVLGLVVVAGLYQFVYSAMTEERDVAAEALAEVEGDIADEQVDLEAVRSGSSDSLRALYERTAALDSTVPNELDGLDFALWLSTSMPAGLPRIDVADIGTPTPSETAQGLSYASLPVTVSGPRSLLLAWAETLQSTPDRLITLQDVSLQNAEDGTSTLSMTLFVWRSSVDPLVTGPAAQPGDIQQGNNPTGPPPTDGSPQAPGNGNGEPAEQTSGTATPGPAADPTTDSGP